MPGRLGRRLYAACPTEKSLLIVDEATHGVSYAIDPAAYETAMTAFYAPLRSDSGEMS